MEARPGKIPVQADEGRKDEGSDRLMKERGNDHLEGERFQGKTDLLDEVVVLDVALSRPDRALLDRQKRKQSAEDHGRQRDSRLPGGEPKLEDSADDECIEGEQQDGVEDGQPAPPAGPGR